MNVTIIGAGYVGYSLAVLIAKENKVICYDIDEEKVDKINKGIVISESQEIHNYLKENNIVLNATKEEATAFDNSDLVIIATSTDFNDETNEFNTDSVEKSVQAVRKHNGSCAIVIKSTVSIGFTENLVNKYKLDKVFYVPEFLRESHSIYDNLFPSRIVVGVEENDSKAIGCVDQIVRLFKGLSLKKDVPIYVLRAREAESIKLFSNAYLAMRVAFFNNLDTFALKNNMSSKALIDAVCNDARIGAYYNNPSFGYGGYCLPKDTKQLAGHCKFSKLINSIVEDNDTRILYMAEQIEKFVENVKEPIVGIYRLTMKSDSDNFRNAAVLKIAKILESKNIKVIIYEPLSESSKYLIKDIEQFKKSSDIIIANRWNKELEDVRNKVFTRDIYNID